MRIYLPYHALNDDFLNVPRIEELNYHHHRVIVIWNVPNLFIQIQSIADFDALEFYLHFKYFVPKEVEGVSF